MNTRSPRTRTVGFVVTGVGLAILAAATGVALTWRDELPDPVATHWGVSGAPDGFMSLGASLAVISGLGALLVVGFGLFTALRGQSAVNRRLGAATVIWLALFLALLQLGSLDLQRGLADARDAGGISGVLTVAFLGSLLPALLVAFLLPGDPRQPATAPVAADAPRVPLGAGERAVWIGNTDAGPGIVVGALSVVVVTVLALVSGEWFLLGVAALLVALLVAMFAFTVRVDAAGLSVRSAAGWPRPSSCCERRRSLSARSCPSSNPCGSCPSASGPSWPNPGPPSAPG